MLSAIVLAAGSSTRMGGANKLLLPFQSSTVIRVTVQQVLESGVAEVIVVTGFQQEQVRAALEGLPVSVVFNPFFATGMTSSIKAGVQASRGKAYMICLGDLPTIRSGEYRTLADYAMKLDSDLQNFIVMPRYEQVRANPVIFSNSFKPVILAHDKPEGCKEIVAANPGNVHWVDMSFDHVLRDIDTQTDYQNLLNANRND